VKMPRPCGQVPPGYTPVLHRKVPKGGGRAYAFEDVLRTLQDEHGDRLVYVTSTATWYVFAIPEAA